VLEPEFRKYHEAHTSNGEYPFEYYLRIYLLGYHLASDERYRDASWDDIESDLRADWELGMPGSWSKFREMIRFARDKTLENMPRP
jgi:hypothetical protein